MPEKSRDRKKSPLKKLAETPPRFTVLSDHALEPSEYAGESFDLVYKLGPVFDILRHAKTKTPLAVAVYGAWGSGKTSAMRCLDGMIETWNKEAGAGGAGVKLRPVWFYPWKYQERADVWRGLVSEVILASIDVKEATFERVAAAVRQFGAFLGRSFVKALTTMKIKAGVAEIDLAKLRDELLRDYEETAHPEKAFLNEFEDTLKSWVEGTIGANERMVVFIDDLDRCLPGVALEVLEALKLYLNIPRLVFVVGVDKEVVDALVREHYKSLGLSEYHSGKYLSKMFQVEVYVDVGEKQIAQFLDERLLDVEFAAEKLSAEERGIFKKCILSLAERNPREVKRLVSSAMMLGAGAIFGTEGGDAHGDELTFAQGMQAFFIHKIMDQRFQLHDLFSTDGARSFFLKWSEVVRANPGMPCFIAGARADARKRREEGGEGSLIERYEARREGVGEKLQLPATVAHFNDIWNEQAYRDLWELLDDKDLGELMHIAFPSEEAAREMSQAVAAASVGTGDVVMEAIARKVGKESSKLTDEDFSAVTELNLRGAQVTDVSALAKLANLKELYLGGTQVGDVSALAKLTGLQRLDLSGTQVADVSTLAKFTTLELLDLSGTEVADVSGLAKLTGLQRLGLSGTQVSDVSMLAKLTNLRELYLDRTQVKDVSALAKFTSLHALGLGSTRVADVSALAKLTNLTWLSLRQTQVADVSALAKLTNLAWLDLGGTQVADVSALAKLTELRELDLEGTKVPKQDIENLRRTLPKCTISFP